MGEGENMSRGEWVMGRMGEMILKWNPLPGGARGGFIQDKRYASASSAAK